MECVKCVCDWLGVGDRELGLGFTNPVGTWGVWACVSVFGCGGAGVWLGRVEWCYVCLCCESGLLVELTGPGICVLCSADTCAS